MKRDRIVVLVKRHGDGAMDDVGWNVSASFVPARSSNLSMEGAPLAEPPGTVT